MLSTVSACVQIFIMKKKKTDCSPSIGFKFLLLKLIFAYVILQVYKFLGPSKGELPILFLIKILISNLLFFTFYFAKDDSLSSLY